MAQSKPLYEMFKSKYTREEIDEVVKTLSNEEIDLLKIKYNNGFDNKPSGILSKEQQKKIQAIYQKMSIRLKRIREKKDLIFKKQKLEEAQRKNEEAQRRFIEKKNSFNFNEWASKREKYSLHELSAINSVLSAQKNGDLRELIPLILLNYTTQEIFILIAAFGHTDKKIAPSELAETLGITELDILNVVAKYDKDYSKWILSEKDLGPRFSSKSHFLQIQDNEKITTKLEKLKSEQQYLIPIAKRFESEQQKYLMPEVLIKYDPREVFIIMTIYECIDNNITFETAIELLGISESDILDITIRYINDCHNYRIKEHEKLNFNFDNYCEGTLSRDIDSYTINEVRVIHEIHKKEEDIFYYARRLLIPEILMMKYTLNEIFIFIAIFGYTERRVSAKKVASLLDISESEILDMAARYDSDFLNYTKTHVVETGVSYSKNMLMKNCDKWCRLQ